MVRIVLALVAAFTAWHLFASFLWIAPVSTVRQVIPGDLLTRYMIPWFGQSWSVFAPDPINGDYRFVVRALVQPPQGKAYVTDWVSASKVEQSMSEHNLFPPRAANAAVHQASVQKLAYDRLTPAQHKTAALNYFEGNVWLGRMMVAMTSSNQNANKGAVIDYVIAERYSDAYATQVARAIWGNQVIRVQYEVSRQNIVPFNERNNPSQPRPPVQLAPTGWRGLIVLPDQSQSDFRAIFRPAYERMTNR